MKYILTQEEIDKMVPKKDLDKARKALDWMLNIFVSRCPHNPNPPPGHPYGYCSECPISDIREPTQIPIPEDGISRTICTRRRRYGK